MNIFEKINDVIDTLNLISKALEKQSPKKVLHEIKDEQEKSGYQETCPNCHCFVFDDYCARCGQKLDWRV